MATVHERMQQRWNVYVPPGWPAQVHPPEAPEWESTAVGFLLDCCPADYRSYPVLRRHPVVLARFAASFVEAQIRASREVVGQARVRLADQVAPDVIQAAVDAASEQLSDLVRVRREVALVEEALRGKVFVQRL